MRVAFAPRAARQLVQLHVYLTEIAGRRTALTYVKRIVMQCRQLRHFPHRGNRHDNIMPGLRMMLFERRVTIAFIVENDGVVIEGVFYGG